MLIMKKVFFILILSLFLAVFGSVNDSRAYYPSYNYDSGMYNFPGIYQPVYTSPLETVVGGLYSIVNRFRYFPPYYFNHGYGYYEYQPFYYSPWYW